jgi:hypothetical protein
MVRPVLIAVTFAFAACSDRALDVSQVSSNDPSGPVKQTTVDGGVPRDDHPACEDVDHCKPVWRQAGTVAVNHYFEPIFVAGLGRRIYFASASNNDASAPQYFKSYDTGDGMFRDEELKDNALDDGGYQGSLLGAAGGLYYLGRDGHRYDPAARRWTTVDVPDAAQRGESSVAVAGDVIYLVGGRGFTSSLMTYDARQNRWTTSGFSDAPKPVSDACAGIVDGKLYLLGGTSHLYPLVYDIATDAWSDLPQTADLDYDCYYRNMVVWRGRLAVVVDGRELSLFNPKDATWKTPIPLDGKADYNYVAVAVVDPGDLYVVAFRAADSTVVISQLTLQ